jgi:hypothetical protein
MYLIEESVWMAETRFWREILGYHVRIRGEKSEYPHWLIDGRCLGVAEER